MSRGDDAFWIGDDATVVHEDVHVILGREERADVALEHEVRLDRALDGLLDLGIGGVDQRANLETDLLLPIRQIVDVDVDAWIRGVRQGRPSIM